MVVKKAVSHKFCKILLTRGVRHIDKLTTHGLLKDSEAEEIVVELDELLEHVLTCDQFHHEGELDFGKDDQDLACSLLPRNTEETSPGVEVEGVETDDNGQHGGFNLDPTDVPGIQNDLGNVPEE